MSANNENSPFKLYHSAGGSISADYIRKVMRLAAGEKYMLHKMEAIDNTGLAASDTDNIKIQAKLGSTVVAEWDTTLTGGDGALPADAWVVAPESKVELIAGDTEQSLSVAVDVTGTVSLGSSFRVVLTLSKI